MIRAANNLMYEPPPKSMIRAANSIMNRPPPGILINVGAGER